MKNWKQLALIVVLSGFVASFALASQEELKLQVTIQCRATGDICTRLYDAFALAHGYRAEIPNPDTKEGEPATIPNPETKQAFMSRIAEQYLLDVASSKEAEAAGQAAREAKKKELEDVLKRPAIQEGAVVPPLR